MRGLLVAGVLAVAAVVPATGAAAAAPLGLPRGRVLHTRNAVVSTFPKGAPPQSDLAVARASYASGPHSFQDGALVVSRDRAPDGGQLAQVCFVPDNGPRCTIHGSLPLLPGAGTADHSRALSLSRYGGLLMWQQQRGDGVAGSDIVSSRVSVHAGGIVFGPELTYGLAGHLPSGAVVSDSAVDLLKVAALHGSDVLVADLNRDSAPVVVHAAAPVADARVFTGFAGGYGYGSLHVLAAGVISSYSADHADAKPIRVGPCGGRTIVEAATPRCSIGPDAVVDGEANGDNNAGDGDVVLRLGPSGLHVEVDVHYVGSVGNHCGEIDPSEDCTIPTGGVHATAVLAPAALAVPRPRLWTLASVSTEELTVLYVAPLRDGHRQLRLLTMTLTSPHA